MELSGLNAVGKPYSASFDPNYRLKHRVATGHLRAPYPTTMRFVGDHPNYDPNLRCFRDENGLLPAVRARSPKPEESVATAPGWKENARKAELTKRAPSGGRDNLSPFLHCWNVD